MHFFCFCFLLGYSCFTTLCQFLLYSEVNQFYVYIYPLFFRFSLVIYFIHSSVYMSIPISQFMPFPSAPPYITAFGFNHTKLPKMPKSHCTLTSSLLPVLSLLWKHSHPFLCLPDSCSTPSVSLDARKSSLTLCHPSALCSS